MKQQIFITFLFTLILHTSAKLRDDHSLFCKFLDNPFIRRYFPDNYQSVERRYILKPEKLQRNFQHAMLNAHNILCKKHCVPPLSLDDKYAEYLAKQESKLIHSDQKGLLGENLFSTTA
jgi:hypothetical protein